MIYAALLLITTVLAYFSPEYSWGVNFSHAFATSSVQGTPRMPFDTMSLVHGTMYQLCSMMAVGPEFIFM
jgi:hypothetical protein